MGRIGHSDENVIRVEPRDPQVIACMLVQVRPQGARLLVCGGGCCLHELVPRALIACLCLHTSSYRSVASLPIQTALLKLRNGATHWVDRRS